MARPAQKIDGVYEKYPGSGTWYVRYKIDGKTVRKKIGTRKQASDYLNKVKLLRATGEGTVARSAKEVTRTRAELEDLKAHGISLGDLCDKYLAHIKDETNPDRPNDQVNPPIRIAAIRKEFGDRSAADIAPHEISAWLRSLKRKPATLNRYKGDFSAVYRYGKELQLVNVNPVRDAAQFGVELKNPRYLKAEEEGRLYEVLRRWIEECPPHHRFTLLELRCHPLEVDVAIGTGLRKGNQYRLMWEWVDLRERLIRIPMTKNGEPHTVPIIDRVARALRELKTIQDEMNQMQQDAGIKPVRMASGGRVFNIRENRSWWESALSEAKIKNLRWHDLRHTTASLMAKAKIPLLHIQKALGHKSIATTTRYAHLDMDDVAEAMTVLNRR